MGSDRIARDEEKAKHLRTLNGLAEAYFADCELGLHRPNAKGPKRPSTLKEERRIYARLIEPRFGKAAISDIKRVDIQAQIKKLSNAVPSNGRISRALIGQILNYAVLKDILDHNPAVGIAVVAPRPRDRVLSEAEFCAFWNACDKPAEIQALTLSIEMSLALRLAAVTLQRGGEVVGMKWSEVDLESRLWTIPGARMKGHRTHVVPLSDLALEILKQCDEMIGGKVYVFQSPRSEGHLDRHAFSRAMNRIVTALDMPKATPHDLRRTGATMLTGERRGISRFIVSLALSHTSDTGGAAAVTGQHYDLNDYLPEKRRAMGAWGSLILHMLNNQSNVSNAFSIGRA